MKPNLALFLAIPLTMLALSFFGSQRMEAEIINEFLEVSTSGRLLQPPCDIGDIYEVTANWNSKPTSPPLANEKITIPKIFAKVITLTNGNKLTNHDRGDGGPGSEKDFEFSVDNVLTPNTSFTSKYLIELASCKRFYFLVSVYGKPIEMNLFRDRQGQKTLDDWPAGSGGDTPRSPKFVLGKEAYIFIRVTGPSGYDDNLFEVEVQSESDSTGQISIALDENVAAGMYQNKEPGDLLALGNTSESGTVKRIKVVEEEILTFELKVLHQDIELSRDVMIDRGECAATTPKDDRVDINGEKRGGSEQEMVESAEALMAGCSSFDPDTTGWFSVGRRYRAPAVNPMAQFILDAGGNQPGSSEADILYIAAHSNIHGFLGGYDDGQPGKYFRHFGPKDTRHFKRTDSSTGGPLEKPDEWYFETRGILNPPVTFSTPPEWDQDIDWAILDACLPLNDQKLRLGRKDAAGVWIPVDTQTSSAWERWFSAFGGNPRGLHGLMGFRGTVGSKIAKSVIEDWIKKVKEGTPIPTAWLGATRINRQDGAVMYVPRNRDDTIDSMEPDPGPGDEPTEYRSTGVSDGTKKKIKKNGKVEAGGQLLIDPEGVDELLGAPDGMFLEGECERFIEFPATHGTLPRLLIQRGETLVEDSIFELDEEGIYRFDLDTRFSFEPNVVTEDEAEVAFREVLEDNFGSLPELETFGVFQYVMSTGESTWNSGFEVILEQRHEDLTIFNSEAYAVVTPEGDVELAEVIFYASEETGPYGILLDSSVAAETAAIQLRAEHPDAPCRLTDMLAYYGFSEPVGSDGVEVRPVWSVEFNLGEAVVTIDGVTGEVLEVDRP